LKWSGYSFGSSFLISGSLASASAATKSEKSFIFSYACFSFSSGESSGNYTGSSGGG
jgi:hypothetical protein